MMNFGKLNRKACEEVIKWFFSLLSRHDEEKVEWSCTREEVYMAMMSDNVDKNYHNGYGGREKEGGFLWKSLAI